MTAQQIASLHFCPRCKGRGEIPGRVAVIALDSGSGYFQPGEGMVVCPKCGGRGIDPACFEGCCEVVYEDAEPEVEPEEAA